MTIERCEREDEIDWEYGDIEEDRVVSPGDRNGYLMARYGHPLPDFRSRLYYISCKYPPGWTPS